jgi:RNA polymerase sigma-70 factor (ECF subfamily)
LVVDLRRFAVPEYLPGVDRLTGLLVQARDGDRLALAAAIRMSQAEVWRVAAHLVGQNEADDVTQDVFVRAWRALPSFRAESSGRTWLLAIARRACADAVRTQSRWRRLTARLHAESAATHEGNRVDELHGLGDLVMRLAPAQREAFVLTQITGCSYAEAAELCGVEIGTIRSRVARARVELIGLLQAARAV